MAEKFPIDMSRGPQSVVEAMALIDFQTGDEWAGMTFGYADQYTDEAIQMLEASGIVPGLPEHQRKYIHDWMWNDG
jgi:hypothetical protein